MAIRIQFDSSHNVIPPTLVLTTRNGNKLGGIIYHNLVVKHSIRQSMEMSFSVNKNDYSLKNGNADLWGLIADFKLVWCKEWNCYFEINVTTNEEYTTDKEITAVSLGDAELSQINLYNIQINTEDDIARDNYEPTVLYNENNTNASLLHRIMEKVPHYTVKHVDPAVASIQRTFTFDNKSLYDAFQEIAEEMECVFDIVCRDGTNGIERTISIFDLENYGNDTNILLSTDALADNINYSIDTGAVKNCFRLEGGDDLMTATIRNCNPNGSGYIWYISNEMKSDMSNELVEQLEKYNEQYDYFYKYYNPLDTEIKNYTGKMLVGKLLQDYGYGGNVDLLHRPLVPMSNVVNSGWDDDVYDEDGTEITATVYTCTRCNEEMTIAANFTPIVVNSTGGYIRTLSPYEMDGYAEDIINGNHSDAEDLRLQIGSFFYGENAVQKAVDAAVRIHELQDYYYLDDSGDEFIDPNIVAEFESSIADRTDVINSYNALVRKYQTYTHDYTEIKTPINGYPAIMEAYYNTIDFCYYLNDSLMPTVQMSNTNARTEANKLHYQSLKNTAIQNLSSTTSVATVNSAIAAMAKTIVDARYQIKVLDDECSFNYSTTEGRSSTWNGKIKVTNYSDEEDTYTAELRAIPISSDYAAFVEQKLKTVLANTREDTIASIEDLFKLEDSAQRTNTPFKAELKRYSLQRLKAFHDACQGCIDVLIQQGIADNNNTESEMYKTIYLPYYNKLGSIQSEMDLRQSEIDIVAGKFDSEGGLLADGMQTVLEKERNAIQDNLDFQDYLGATLWQEFVAYRREDTYSNTNYVSDGLDNDELFARAMEFIQTAKDEIEKSATKQHTINARLKNLLVMKEFASIVDCFEVGNWLRLKVDGKLFKLRLVDYQIDFENLESIDITFSDIVVDGTEATAKDILNQAASMATSYNTVSRQARKGDKTSSMVDNFVNDGLALTTTKIIDTADNQEVSWDKHGLVCREYNNLTDSYSDKQVKLINKGVYITDNGWRTAKAGIGNFTFFNPAANNGEGEYQEAYGVIADTIVGNVILGKNVGIYNTKNSITMDEDGFVLTTDGTGSDDPQSVFTIRRKTMNNETKSFKDMFYIDSNGFVTINGGVKIDIDGESNSSTMVEMVDGKITTHITDELADGGLIESSISQTAGEIKSTVAEATSKYDETDYTISARGYGVPTATEPSASNYNNLLYLDQETGTLYKSNGSSWNVYKDNDNNDVVLPLITSNLSSSISQTASNIKSTVTATLGWDISSLNYTISIIGTEDRSSVVSEHDKIGIYDAADYQGKYYLDSITGHVYQSRPYGDGYHWWYEGTLSRTSSNLYSQIEQSAGNISAVVANLNNNYYKKAELQITENGVTSSVTDYLGGTFIQQRANDVKIAWNNNSQYISFEGAALNIYNSSTQDTTTLLMKLNNTGLGIYESVSGADSRLKMKMHEEGASYYCEGSKIGTIGTSGMDTMKGLVFHLENTAQYMAWSWKETANASAYTLKFFYYPLTTYVAGSDTTYTKGFYFADDVYFRYPVTFTNTSGNSVTFNNAATTFNRNVTFANNSNNSVIFNNPDTTFNHDVAFNSSVFLNGNIATDVQMDGNALYLDSSSYITAESTGALAIVGRSDKALFLTGYGGGKIAIGAGGVEINTDVTVSGTVTSSSDSRLKANISKSTVDVLPLLLDIELKEFDWLTDDTHTSVGIIAQQLQEVIPELVYHNNETGMLSIKVDRFVPFIIKGIQELYDMIGGNGSKGSHKNEWEDVMSDYEKLQFLSLLYNTHKNKKDMRNQKRVTEKVEEPISIITDVPNEVLKIQNQQ